MFLSDMAKRATVRPIINGGALASGLCATYYVVGLVQPSRRSLDAPCEALDNIDWAFRGIAVCDVRAAQGQPFQRFRDEPFGVCPRRAYGIVVSGLRLYVER